MKIQKSILSAFLFLFSIHAWAANVRIAQIDSSTLLLNQKVKAYVSVTQGGIPFKGLTKKNFKVFESVTKKNSDYKEVPIISFKKGTDNERGINFLLLVDNSGSMYANLSGRYTGSIAQRRIAIAKRVITTFLKSVKNPRDKIGLAVFNTYYTSFSSPTGNKVEIEQALDKIKRPNKEQYYTEIYASLCMAVDEFRSIKGRKAIIILSDGRNDYYSATERKSHKVFGKKLYKYTESIKSCLQEGISVFAINFGAGRKDNYLPVIANQTGGTTFNASSESALGLMYRRIVDLIINEYQLTYKATMDPAELKHVRIRLNNRNNADRYYFSSTIFGLPVEGFSPLLILPFLLALLLLWLLSKMSFDRTKGGPALDFLDGSGTVVFNGKKGGATMPLTGSAKTVIGLGSGKTMISTDPGLKIKGDNATIAFDKTKNAYVLNATRPIKVNNKSVQTKVLQSGDVLNIEGKTIVFDKGVEEK